MKRDQLTRRNVLRGIGGATLALPLLPSLLDATEAHAASDDGTSPIFIGLTTPMGQNPGSWAATVPSEQVVEAHVRVAPLQDIADANGGALNSILGTMFSDLMTKMTMIAKLDCQYEHPNGSGHQRLFPFTAFAQKDRPLRHDSIDTIFSKSSYVYASEPQERILRLNPYPGAKLPYTQTYYTSSWENGERQPQVSSDVALFDRLFGNFTPTEPGDQGPDKETIRRRKIVDLVNQDLGAFLKSPKLSGEDKRRVASYVNRLSELENRLGGSATPTAPCTLPTLLDTTVDDSADNFQRIYSNFIDMVVMALSCGMTKVVNMQIFDAIAIGGLDPSEFLSTHGYTHDPTPGDLAMTDEARRWAVLRISELVHKLDDVVTGDGTSLLDNCIVLYTSEQADAAVHRGNNMPVVMFGGGKETINNGYRVNYQRDPGSDTTAGRPYNELMISIMAAMGLSYADWEADGEKGFGYYNNGPGPYGPDKYMQFTDTDAKRRRALPWLLKNG